MPQERLSGVVVENLDFSLFGAAEPLPPAMRCANSIDRVVSWIGVTGRHGGLVAANLSKTQLHDRVSVIQKAAP